MWIFAAFSITDKLNKYDNYAGVAALVGLAVLTLLYFAQAREVKRLREWAGRAPERAQELEESVIDRASTVRAPVQPNAQAAMQKSVSPNVTVIQRPAANPLLPTSEKEEAPAAEPAGSEDQPTQAVPVVSGGPVTAAGGAYVSPPGTPPFFADGAAEKTSTDAEGDKQSVSGSDQQEPQSSETETKAESKAGVASTGDVPSVEGAVTPPPPPTLRRQQQLRNLERTPAQVEPKEVRRSLFLPLLLLGALALGAGGYLVAVQLMHDDGSSSSQSTSTTTGSSSSKAATAGKRKQGPVVRSKTTVAVLNGTTSNGLAAQVADQLQGAGFKRGTVDDAPDQQRLTTTVYYKRGYQREGRSVAAVAGVKDLKRIDPDTQAVAGAGAVVVVVVGADKTP